MPPELKELEFPLYKYYISPEMIRRIFEKLKEYPGDIPLSTDKYPGDSILFIKINYDRDKNFLMLSDYFNMEARMKSHFLNNPSPWNFFQKSKKEAISVLGPRPDFESVYGYLWKNTKMCSTFPILVAKSILTLYKPRNVFDPCAGWGDRMLACIASDIPYIGVDPNVRLQKGYRDMIDFFDLSPEEYCVYPSCFEGFSSDGLEKFDLIFTSPPFFNMETYHDKGSQDTQSSKKFPTYDKWLKGFLFPMLKKCETLLEKNGKIVIYVNNIKGYPILNDTKGYMSILKLRYLGKIVWQNNKYPKSVLVYQKD